MGELATGPAGWLFLLLFALVLDALIGDPPWLWRSAPHPVVLIGRLIDFFDRRINRQDLSAAALRARGVLTLIVLVIGSAATGYLLNKALDLLPFGYFAELLLVAVLIAQRDLFDHVKAVAVALEKTGLAGGRQMVSRIVGRDPESLDEAGVCRAALESLAENFSDGVVAPVLWYLLAGLPGLLLYKAVNTADSMIGHKSERYRYFGWASARFDDLLNLPASRLSALWILLAAATMGRLKQTWSAIKGDANRHRSPNAGWPEAAMAGALGLAFAGPRRYGQTLVEDAWMNATGRREANAKDIRRGLRLYGIACLFQGVTILGLALLLRLLLL